MIHKVHITQVSSLECLREAFESGLTRLYQDVFAAPPYFEQFSQGEVEDAFNSYTIKGILFLAYLNNAVVGFGAAMPFKKSSIAYLEEKFEMNLDNTWYMADLGVREDLRRKGIAKRLVQVRLDKLSSGTMVIVRTAQTNLASQSLYSSLGFHVLSITEDINQQRQDGTVQTDRRIFMLKVIDSDDF